MGPRSFDRGKVQAMASGSKVEPLQWGRGHSTAESLSLINGPSAPAELQWGRGHSTAERC